MSARHVIASDSIESICDRVGAYAAILLGASLTSVGGNTPCSFESSRSIMFISIVQPM